MLFDMDRVLGLSLKESATAKEELSADERAVFDRREGARKAGDYIEVVLQFQPKSLLSLRLSSVFRAEEE